jgi:sugar-specific transcriptional regulator TrmB
MSDQTDNYTTLVKSYGLSEGESRIYLYLLKNDFLTALELSRKLNMGRTKVYRLLDKLKDKQLVEYQVHTRGIKFGASHPMRLKHMVQSQEHKVERLKENLPNLIDHLIALMPEDVNQGKVLYYEGLEGLKQVSYNITRASDMVRVFEMEHLSDFLSLDFAEDVRQELIDKNIYTRDLTNQTEFSGFTDKEELIANLSEFRHISPNKLKIRFETLIYNDVYATYTYQSDKIFCVEIYNEQLAQMQKQLFDFIWSQAQIMEFTDKRGGARVVSS